MATDWTKLYQKYRGLWLALQKDEVTVVASGKTAQEAWDKALAKGYRKPTLTKVPDRLATYVGQL